MPGVCHFDGKGSSSDLQHEIGNFLERNVGHMGAWPASPTNVVADAVTWQAAYRLIQYFHMPCDPSPIVSHADGRHSIVSVCDPRIIELKDKASVYDCFVLRLHRQTYCLETIFI